MWQDAPKSDSTSQTPPLDLPGQSTTARESAARNQMLLAQARSAAVGCARAHPYDDGDRNRRHYRKCERRFLS